MTPSLIRLLSSLSKYTILFAVLIGLAKWKKLVPVQVKIFSLAVFYIATEVLSDKNIASGLWIMLWGKENNLPVLHLFTVIQFSLIIWIYQKFLQHYISNTKISLLIGAFAVFGLINAAWIDGIFYLNPHARAIQSIILLGVILFYFTHLLRSMEVKELEKEPLFWISAGMTIYFSGSFLIFLFSNYLLQTNEVLYSIYGIHSILNVVANVFIAIALWVVPPRV